MKERLYLCSNTKQPPSLIEDFQLKFHWFQLVQLLSSIQLLCLEHQNQFSVVGYPGVVHLATKLFFLVLKTGFLFVVHLGFPALANQYSLKVHLHRALALVAMLTLMLEWVQHPFT